MAIIIDLDDYLKRQKEIFSAFMDSSGKEVSVTPFVSKYEKEDNTNYASEDLLKYLNSYVNSNLITEEEKELFNKTKLVPSDLIFKRGRLIIEALIESQGDTSDLPRLGAEFAKKDGKLKPYDNKYLLKCRDYYLKKSKNADILLAYKNVCELVSRGSYDIELPLKILEISSNEKAIEFINRINISKTSLRKLVNEYETLYPANTANITRLNYLLKEAYKTDNKVVKFIEQKVSHDTIKDRLVHLRRILEEYLISDIEDISELFNKHNFNSYKFKETLKDAKSSRDILLNNLISKYEAKRLSINNSYKELISKIMQAKYNGINYGYGYREFNSYDYYTLKDGIEAETLIKHAKMIYESEDAKEFEKVINEFEIKDTTTREELSKLYTGDANTDLILDYLEYANLPISTQMFEAIKDRFENNDITFEVVENAKVVNI